MTEKLAYSEIEVLVYAYQEGSKEAIEKLLAHYDGYFMKFLGVLKQMHPVYRGGQRVMRYTKFDIYNNIQRRFATAFIPSHIDRNSVNLYRKNPAMKTKVYRAVNLVRELLLNEDAEDLKQIMQFIFIEMAAYHKGTKFYNYVSTTFPKKLLAELMKIFKRVKQEPFNEDEVWDYGYIHYDEYQLSPSPVRYRIKTDQTMYDDNWINGDCEEIFDHLTPHERRLLKLYFEEKTFFPEDFQNRSMYDERRLRYKCSDSDLGERFGCSRKTINQKRLAAVASVRERALEQRLIEE